jgi:hypothetical protein
MKGHFFKEKRLPDTNRATSKTESNLSHLCIPHRPVTYQIFNHWMPKEQSNFITNEIFNMERSQGNLLGKKEVKWGKIIDR